MLFKTIGSLITVLMASASAAESPWGTTFTAPLACSSMACGKAVAITGRPAASASTSTPDVTWSFESYGSSTSEALATKRVSWSTLRYVSSKCTDPAMPFDHVRRSNELR